MKANTKFKVAVLLATILIILTMTVFATMTTETGGMVGIPLSLDDMPDLIEVSTSQGPVVLSAVQGEPTEITGEIPYGIDRITLKVTAQEDTDTITLAGDQITSAADEVIENLRPGVNTYSIVVTPETGGPREYTLAITRTTSANADLSDIEVEVGAVTIPLSPEFDPDTLLYTVGLDSAASSMVVTTTVSDSNATLEINGQAAANGAGKLLENINYGVTPVEITVTSTSGESKSYYVFATRQFSGNSKLSALALTSDGGDMDMMPEFSNDVVNYTVVLAGTTTTVEVETGAQSPDALITINQQYVPSGEYTLNIVPGINILAVKVFARDGSTTTYTVNLVREEDALSFNKLSNIIYINGYVDGTFRPDLPVTRGQVAKMLYNLIQDPAKETYAGTSEFTDLPPDHWSYKEIRYLAGKGIMNGYKDNTFGPDKSISRAEFITTICRIETPQGTPTSTPGTDIVNHWAKANILWAMDKGWISGFPDGTFRPDAQLSRVQAVIILNRVLARSFDVSALQNPFGDITTQYPYYADILRASMSPSAG